MTDPEKKKATHRRYYANHREKIRTKNLAYYWANKEICDARSKEYAKKNREKIRELNRKCYYRKKQKQLSFSYKKPLPIKTYMVKAKIISVKKGKPVDYGENPTI